MPPQKPTLLMSLTNATIFFNNALCSYIFGIVTIVTGILGGSIGTVLSRSFRDKVPYVDPLICAVGLLGSVPCFISSIFLASLSIPAAYVRKNFNIFWYPSWTIIVIVIVGTRDVSVGQVIWLIYSQICTDYFKESKIIDVWCENSIGITQFWHHSSSKIYRSTNMY